MQLDRNLFALIFILCMAALLAALFSQHALGMAPCAWCVLQRVILLVMAGLALLGWLGPACRWIRGPVAGLMVVTGAIGAWAAWHQLTVAAKQFSCDQTLADRIVSASGLDALVPWLFGIYATCLDAAVSLLGLEFAVWSLGLFVALALAALGALWVSCRLPQSQG